MDLDAFEAFSEVELDALVFQIDAHNVAAVAAGGRGTEGRADLPGFGRDPARAPVAMGKDASVVFDACQALSDGVEDGRQAKTPPSWPGGIGCIKKAATKIREDGSRVPPAIGALSIPSP